VKQTVDLRTWARREHFEFFSTFEEPYYGVCVKVDCTAAYAFAKREGMSFFLYYLYQTLVAAQRVEAFRLRIEDGGVVMYDKVDGGSTVGRADGTFGYGYFPFTDDLKEFMEAGRLEVERVRGGAGLQRTPRGDILRCSALPWLDFTSISHARRFSAGDSCPWISFGKMTEQAGRRSMPVSVHVNHALVDGLHVGQWVECFQRLMNGEQG
jgi:chloramphenicol O-acetyltransferase type A